MSDKPKALLYRDALTAVEQRIVNALPEIIDGLVARAKEGDTKAAVYLCDRILGRVASLEAAPVEDRRAPYTDDAFELDQKCRAKLNQSRLQYGALRGA
jgi:hypothetical protein